MLELVFGPLAPSVLGLRPKPPPSRREVFTEPFYKVTIPGTGGAVTNRRKLSCEIDTGGTPAGGSGK